LCRTGTGLCGAAAVWRLQLISFGIGNINDVPEESCRHRARHHHSSYAANGEDQ
jgi:hypothetical protein